MTETPQPAPAPARFDWDRLIGLSALITSVVTVAFLAYQAYLMRVQVEASTWPYMQISEVCCGDGLKIVVHNKGVGPAIVKSATVTVDGKPQRNWQGVLQALLGEDVPIAATTTLVRQVLDSGESISVLSLDNPELAARVHAEFLKGRIVAAACYCSVLEKCWLAMPGRESKDVSSCPEPAPGGRFEQ
jgi:hypothetical protein